MVGANAAGKWLLSTSPRLPGRTAATWRVSVTHGFGQTYHYWTHVDMNHGARRYQQVRVHGRTGKKTLHMQSLTHLRMSCNSLQQYAFPRKERW